MKIEKEYDVQELANKVKQEIEKCGKCGTVRVGVDFITAQGVVDVLEIVASWENKRTKLRDIREEKCEKKKERKRTLCDDCLMKSCCNVDCTHEHITEQMLGDLIKCFGKSYGRYTVACCNCKYKEQCEVLTKHE